MESRARRTCARITVLLDGPGWLPICISPRSSRAHVEYDAGLPAPVPVDEGCFSLRMTTLCDRAETADVIRSYLRAGFIVGPGDVHTVDPFRSPSVFGEHEAIPLG
jgi:hypothetical protein